MGSVCVRTGKGKGWRHEKVANHVSFVGKICSPRTILVSPSGSRVTIAFMGVLTTTELARVLNATMSEAGLVSLSPFLSVSFSSSLTTLPSLSCSAPVPMSGLPRCTSRGLPGCLRQGTSMELGRTMNARLHIARWISA